MPRIRGVEEDRRRVREDEGGPDLGHLQEGVQRCRRDHRLRCRIGLALATGGASLLVAGAIVCAVAGATVSVVQTTGLGEKFLTEVCKMKPDDAQKLMTGLVIGFAVAGILFTGGASLMGAAGRAAPMIMTSMPKLIGNMLAKVAGGVALASGVGAGVSSIGKSVAGGELTDIRTDRKGLEADYKRLQQQQKTWSTTSGSC